MEASSARDAEEVGTGLTPRADETDASKCTVSGEGLKCATCRTPTYFWITAHDAAGQQRACGGDTFFVAVRGPSAVRARVVDNGDGTYLAVWKPSTSGVYSITISLFGITLPGVPFQVVAATNQPCPSKCEVRGDALHRAVSRNTHAFEVLFKDRLGQVASAVELDVFVEQVPHASAQRPHRASRAQSSTADASRPTAFVLQVPPSSPRQKAGSAPVETDKDKEEREAQAAKEAKRRADDRLAGVPRARKKAGAAAPSSRMRPS